MASNNHLRELCEGLATGKLLPSNVQANVLHCDEAISAAGRPVEADALIEFRVKEVQQEPITAVLEFKSRLTPLILEGTIHQVLGISNSLRASAAYGDVYPMVGAPYISESVQNRCKELGVGYVDLNGTLLLARGSIYVDVIRPSRWRREPPRGGSAPTRGRRWKKMADGRSEEEGAANGVRTCSGPKESRRERQTHSDARRRDSRARTAECLRAPSRRPRHNSPSTTSASGEDSVPSGPA